MDIRHSQFIHSRKSTFLALIIWIGVVFLFFSPATVGNKVIAPIDCLECVFRPFADKPIENVHNHFVIDGISQYLPYKWSIKTSFEEDGYIGWNPYTFNGNPISDNTMTSPGDPFNLLYAVLPFWFAWDLSIVLQFFIAGCGMILLLRHFKIPMWGALLAAISFAFYSQFILWMYHKWVGAMVWSPFLVWALTKYKHRLINVPAIIFMSLTWRTGHLQSCVFAFILVSCVWVDEIWKKNGTWPSRKTIQHITSSFLLTGILGALLSLDVFVDTLQRMGGCKEMPFEWGINNLLTYPTLLIPTILGIPETLDAAKAFQLSLFDIKYGGGIVFILSLIGCFNKRAPRAAKILFLASILLTLTPLFTYIYSRSTVIMGLGMAWLAAWQIYDFTQVQYEPKYWKRILLVLGGLLALWLIVSIIICFFRQPLVDFLNNTLEAHTTAQRAGRAAWHELRVERFLSQILIWDWRNLILALCLISGIYCCTKIRPNHKCTRWIACVALLTYTELLVFSHTWITYSEKPDSPYLYNEPSWMVEFKTHVKDGALAIYNTSGDWDFHNNNHMSTYGIRLADGYETFRPEYLQPLHSHPLTVTNYAEAGISHIICDTKWKDAHFPGWELAMTGPDFKLYANPAYKGRYLLNGTTHITPNKRTSNSIHLTIPDHSQSITILESYHPGWKAYLSGEKLRITPTTHGGMLISLPDADINRDLTLEFHMPYRWWYHSIMLLTLLGLIIVIVKQKHHSKV